MNGTLEKSSTDKEGRREAQNLYFINKIQKQMYPCNICIIQSGTGSRII